MITTKDSEGSLRQISLAILGTLMGHFETFEKALFAGLVERSVLFPTFDLDKFLKHFDKHAGGDVIIAPTRLLAFRATSAPVGFIIADSLTAWHNPARVNSFFKAFGVQKDFFGTQEVSDLEVLWQLRHSIVHTGAWLNTARCTKGKTPPPVQQQSDRVRTELHQRRRAPLSSHRQGRKSTTPRRLYSIARTNTGCTSPRQPPNLLNGQLPKEHLAVTRGLNSATESRTTRPYRRRTTRPQQKEEIVGVPSRALVDLAPGDILKAAKDDGG